MFEHALSPEGRAVLKRLSAAGALAGFYLAGGTGVTLQLGHRLSFDLDFFAPTAFDAERKIQELGSLGSLSILFQAAGTLHVALDGVKLSFLLYSYPLLFPTHDLAGVAVADLRDLGLMKLSAIAGRGTKRDFIDLYVICQDFTPLSQLLQLFPRKYSTAGYSRYHLARSLSYFEDAERDPPPLLLRELDWAQVKAFFLSQRPLVEVWAGLA